MARGGTMGAGSKVGLGMRTTMFSDKAPAPPASRPVSAGSNAATSFGRSGSAPGRVKQNASGTPGTGTPGTSGTTHPGFSKSPAKGGTPPGLAKRPAGKATPPGIAKRTPAGTSGTSTVIHNIKPPSREGGPARSSSSATAMTPGPLRAKTATVSRTAGPLRGKTSASSKSKMRSTTPGPLRAKTASKAKTKTKSTTPKLTGRANALTRGKGKKIGLKRKVAGTTKSTGKGKAKPKTYAAGSNAFSRGGIRTT